VSRVRTASFPVAPVAPALVPALAISALALALGCGSSAATTVLVPITGITVRAESLTANLGCGTANAQIFKYAVVVLGKNPNGLGAFDTYIASNVYDCFSDGQFVNLPASGGVTDYALQIYAYSAPSYQAAGGDAAVRAAVLNPGALPATNPTYSTTCTATEIGDVQALAVCKPLAVGAAGAGAVATGAPASVTVGAGKFLHGDGGTASCDGEYATVRYRATPMGGTAGPITDVRCSHLTTNGVEPVTITISPAVAPTTYGIEIALLRVDGSVFGQTTCAAQTSPGLSSSAVCQSVP
jgi:hypothetical protein